MMKSFLLALYYLSIPCAFSYAMGATWEGYLFGIAFCYPILRIAYKTSKNYC